eukprot:1707418-Pyramimonas_sp.AAC.1
MAGPKRRVRDNCEGKRTHKDTNEKHRLGSALWGTCEECCLVWQGWHRQGPSDADRDAGIVGSPHYGKDAE